MSPWFWIGFVALVLALMALDLGVANRRKGANTLGTALAWFAFYVTLALAFNVGIYFLYEHGVVGAGASAGVASPGREAAIQFFTAWLVEESLSLDNIFVIALILTYFGIPENQQHRVLFWGILGVLVLRGILIAGGTYLMARFEWVIYVFGAVLLLTAIRMMFARPERVEPGKNPLVRLARRFLPVTEELHGSQFFVSTPRGWAITPLFLALLVVESTDLIFAFDSIPAVFAVTSDPFLVFTSNVFAVLGLRSMYFVLASLIERFRYLKTSLVFVLAYVGVKILISHTYPIPNAVSLIAVASILGAGIVASSIVAYRERVATNSTLAAEISHLGRITLRQARRVVIGIVGVTLLALGLVFLLLPGPGFPAILLGLAILALEFVWARRWLAKIRATYRAVRAAVDGKPHAEPSEPAGEPPGGRSPR
ncbi:MAG: TerC family protein [Planctomycetota bacterium]